MKKVIVVGAGTTGTEIAGRIRNSVLVDADPGKVMILRREHPEWDIVGGDATDPAVLEAAGIRDASHILLTTDKDYYSQKIALTAKGLDPEIKIMAVVHKRESYTDLKDAGIDIIISPIAETIDAVVQRLLPFGENITEIAISHQSPALGKAVKEIELPPDTTIGAILRGHHLLRPEPDTVLEKGDVVSIVSLGQLEEEVIDAISGARGTMVPIDHFVCLFIDEEDLRIADEVIMLASKVQASCHFIITDRLIGHQSMISERCGTAGVEVSVEPYMGNILEKFRNIVADTAPSDNVLFVIPQRKISMLRYHLPANYVELLAQVSAHPIYIPKEHGFKRFERVIHLIDGAHHCALSSGYALGMAKVCGTNLKPLVAGEEDTTVCEEILIHTRRVAKVFGVDVQEEIMEGNPTLEFIQKIRETGNQLVIVNWNCQTMRRDIIRKIVNEAEASVLLMK